MLQQTIKRAERTTVYGLVFSIPLTNVDNITVKCHFLKPRNCVDKDIIEIIL